MPDPLKTLIFHIVSRGSHLGDKGIFYIILVSLLQNYNKKTTDFYLSSHYYLTMRAIVKKTYTYKQDAEAHHRVETEQQLGIVLIAAE